MRRYEVDIKEIFIVFSELFVILCGTFFKIIKTWQSI